MKTADSEIQLAHQQPSETEQSAVEAVRGHSTEENLTKGDVEAEAGHELRGLDEARMKRALYILTGQADLASSAKEANFPTH